MIAARVSITVEPVDYHQRINRCVTTIVVDIRHPPAGWTGVVDALAFRPRTIGSLQLRTESTQPITVHLIDDRQGVDRRYLSVFVDVFWKSFVVK